MINSFKNPAIMRILRTTERHGAGWREQNFIPHDAVIIGYGDICAEEQALFRRLAERNAKNMCFAHYTIRFVSETEIETAVEEEVAGWKNS